MTYLRRLSNILVTAHSWQATFHTGRKELLVSHIIVVGVEEHTLCVYRIGHHNPIVKADFSLNNKALSLLPERP
jgi:hypothetical protein